MNDLKKHILFRYSDAVAEACLPLKHMNIEGFIFMRRFPDGSFLDLSNQLKWSEDFLRRYLDGKIDIRSAQDHMLIHSGISLWSHNPENSIWIEGRQEWGFFSGISITKEGPNWMDVFCFYSRKTPLEMDVEFLKNFRLLEKFTLYFVEQFHKIIKEGENCLLKTPSIYLKKPSLNQTKFLKNLNIYSLSARERECIFHVAKGNTAAEVGKIMHLSRRTVETYLKNAKEKLDVRKTSDLIKLFPEW